MIKWAGNFRLVFGRSKTGVDYLATGSKLHLIVLLVAGKGRVRMHLEVLAAVAELLNDKEFRKDSCHRRHVRNIEQLLVERAAQQPLQTPQTAGGTESKPRRCPPRCGIGRVMCSLRY